MNRGAAFYRNVARLALPILLQNLCTTLLGLIDTFMVGALGEAPLAAVLVANIPVFVIQLVIFGLQSGSSVLISQFWGKGDTESINRVIGLGCYVAGAISLAFASVMFFLPEQLMGLLTDNQELVPLAAQYARIVGFSYIFNSLTGVYVGAHRSMENPKLGMIIFGVSMLTNAFLNWVFIFGNLGAPALGVVGAAVATLSARVLEFVIMLSYALTNRRFRLKPAVLFRPGRALLAKFLHYSGPVVLNETLWGLGTSLSQVIMGHLEGSTEILAARALAGNIEDLCTVAIFAIGNTTAIIVGREIGAGRREHVYEVGATLDTLAFLCGLIIGIPPDPGGLVRLPLAGLPLLPPVGDRRLHHHHDADLHRRLSGPAGLRLGQHRGRPAGRRRRAGRHHHRHHPPVVRLPPPGRPVRPGVPVGHLLGLCGHHGRAIRQVRHWPVPPPLPGVDQRRHPVLPYGVTAL